MDGLSNVVTVPEVASLFGINRQEVYRAIWSKKLPARKILGRWVIERYHLPDVWFEEVVLVR